MAFDKVNESDSRSGSGNFGPKRRELFNKCGSSAYMGSIKFKDSNYQVRRVPIFLDECLDDLKESYKLLKQLRKTMELSFEYSMVYPLTSGGFGSHRSIHQNENGYLPYKNDGGVGSPSVSAPAISIVATLFGQLPNNQTQVGAKTKGHFLEYTFGDEMHQDCRFIVDFRFGLIYMTLGHYNSESFALLVRSEANLIYDVKPTLSVLGADFDP